MLAKLALRVNDWVRSGGAKGVDWRPKLIGAGLWLWETNGVLGVPNSCCGRGGLLTTLLGPGVAVIGGKDTRFEGVSGMAYDSN